MKEKVIQTAGKIWWYLGEKGQTQIAALPKSLNEDSTIVFQALGWLAREDKITYSENNKKSMVSLIESELQNFQNALTEAQPQEQLKLREKGGNNRIKTLASARN